ncbi:MAG: glycosyltransferase family 2 protein [Muribaculaceae bacterium]|nr:glycosyltransferase family 2 protein [Muribaculaceae bacterium]
MKSLTVFTPTYNRSYTLGRLYESLATQTCMDFEWLVVDDGSSDNTKSLIEQYIKWNRFPIRYIYKENGGLYTTYNTAYANTDTELSICIDSDDYMPENAVELILDKWQKDGSDKYCGIVGLDFYETTNQPIAGYFPDKLKECYYLDLYQKNIHKGDCKLVMRTELMKRVIPQIGFPGEKFFNPVYMILQVCDDNPLLVLNENLCYVGTDNNDRMSTNIWSQYRQSPRSFAKLRELEMGLKRSTLKNKFRTAIHYVADNLLAKNKDFFKDTRHKIPVVLSIVPGIFLFYLLKFKK